MKAEVIISDNEHKCCICGKPTRYIEINYQAPFCSDECISEMDRRSNAEFYCGSCKNCNTHFRKKTEF